MAIWTPSSAIRFTKNVFPIVFFPVCGMMRADVVVENLL
jgi:hypothetical protein